MAKGEERDNRYVHGRKRKLTYRSIVATSLAAAPRTCLSEASTSGLVKSPWTSKNSAAAPSALSGSYEVRSKDF